MFNKICFIGMGYIGLPTASFIASKGIKVIGVDINSDVVNNINIGKITMVEPGLEPLVKSVVDNGFLRATIKPEISDIYIIVVPTPFKEGHIPDVSFVKNATESVIPLLKEGDTYIIESTSPVGTTELMAEIIYNQRPELKDKIFIAYCPERVLPGNIIAELENNDRVIGGIDKISTEKACKFYSSFVKGNLHKTNCRTAEMCKLTENASRDVQIAFANELSIICNSLDIDVWELINLANKHPRVKILNPGSGVGGHCIAVDPWFIVAQNPNEASLMRTAREVNDFKAEWCINKIKQEIFNFEKENNIKPVVACMGLSFKPNIDDLRESPAKYITTRILHDFNNESIYIVEPNLTEHNVFKLTDFKLAYEKADIVVFLVAHDNFRELEYNKNKVILDFCGMKKFLN
jgi:UDP-N-acetyl-D-mannosaminuronic acid dehydrogenase